MLNNYLTISDTLKSRVNSETVFAASKVTLSTNHLLNGMSPTQNATNGTLNLNNNSIVMTGGTNNADTGVLNSDVSLNNTSTRNGTRINNNFYIGKLTKSTGNNIFGDTGDNKFIVIADSGDTIIKGTARIDKATTINGKTTINNVLEITNNNSIILSGDNQVIKNDINNNDQSNVLPAVGNVNTLTSFLQTIRNNLKWLFNAGNLASMLYPVGSIYFSVSSNNPRTYFPGTTWVAWGSGKVPVGVNVSDTDFNTTEKTGGEKTHALAQTEMPSHTHTQNAHSHTATFDYKRQEYHTHIQNPHNHGINGSVVLGQDDRLLTGSNKSALSRSTHGIAATNQPERVIFYADAVSVESATATNQYTGNNGAHNNLQPYITCYMWKRTA